ncbi:thiol-activated cytolysin family protein [Maribacter sp. CXY002]|uniref:thiol-activated cytolysin family protein n=1 Tax=Maribacter luteocoastalis TaxID=3407671 RepID=UPI003B674F3C
MKKKNKLFSRFFIQLLLILAVACSKDDPSTDITVNPSTGATLKEVLAQAGDIEEFPREITKQEGEPVPLPQPEKFDRKDSANLDITVEQRWVCTTKEIDIFGGTDTNPVYNPNATVIWPGNLLQYKSLDNGTPEAIDAKRAGGSITYDLNVGNPEATQKVDVVDQGSVNQAMNNIIAGNPENITPADFSLEIVAINSSEELALEMGLKVSTLVSKVNSNFSLDTKVETSSVLVKLKQRYYTMSFVKPNSPDEFFDPSITAEDLAQDVQPGNPATYISSVTYGRIFYMLYESTASAEDMKATLEGSYGAAKNKVTAEVDIQKLNEYNQFTVKVIAYGGDSESTLNAVGEIYSGENAVSNLKQVVDRLALAGDIRNGKPLSYVVNSVLDPSKTVKTNLATKYSIRNCELRGILPPTGYHPLLDLFKTDNDEGGIGAMLQIRDGDILVFNKAGTRYAWFDGNEAIIENRIKGIWDITDPTGPIGGTTFTSIGASTRFGDNKIYIFNDNGLANEIFNYDPNTASPVGGPIGLYNQTNGENIVYSVNTIFGDSGGFPYTNQGFAAGARFTLAGRKIFFGGDGSTYALYDSTGGGSWGGETENKLFGTGGDNDPGATLFEKVGASTYISFGGASGGWLFVNDKGDELMEYKNDTDSFEGPWVIN